MTPCDSRRRGSASRAKRLIHMDEQDAQDFFRKRLARNPEHRQTRTGSSPQPASGAGTFRPVNPVNPVHRCSKKKSIPGRRCRAIQVAERARLCRAVVRAGRPRSRVGFLPDRVTPRGQNCRSISGPAVVEGGPSVFVSIRVHSWFVFIGGHLFFVRMICTEGRGPRPTGGTSSFATFWKDARPSRFPWPSSVSPTWLSVLWTAGGLHGCASFRC